MAHKFAETTAGFPVLNAACAQDEEIVALLKAAGAKGTPEQCEE